MDANDLAAYERRRRRERWAEEQDKLTRVQFRVLEGDVIALFPDTAGARSSMCGSYMHVGQHSDAARALIRELDPATPDQYAPLQAELERVGYVLRVEP